VAIDILMPALSPTMESGTLAKWLVKEGDAVKAGDLLAEIETDKATMEFEAADEGTVAKLVVPEGTDEVKVGQLIAVLVGEDEDVADTESPPAEVKGYGAQPAQDVELGDARAGADQQGGAGPGEMAQANGASQARVKASPLARRLASARGIDLAALQGSGPGGRIVKADLERAAAGAGPGRKAEAGAAAPAPAAVTSGTERSEPAPAPAPASTAAPQPKPGQPDTPAAPLHDAPYEAVKLSGMRKVIARRLTEAKQQVPHIYLTVDVRLDALLKLRRELNDALKAQLSVNDLLIKALAIALRQVPGANVQFAGDQLLRFSRADISVAVAVPDGLITPIIRNADGKRVTEISSEMRELAGRARDGKLKPEEYQGGTASLSNLGMFGIKHFDAVVNPPQAMILAVGMGEKRPVVANDAVSIATIMTATASFDHRAVDGAVGAELLAAFRTLCENPITMLA
jgi:pyruvate dehydrogenase E2 component (dihydrolipoamide acetyltransferase)